jgi:hypothetical protein
MPGVVRLVESWQRLASVPSRGRSLRRTRGDNIRPSLQSPTTRASAPAQLGRRSSFVSSDRSARGRRFVVRKGTLVLALCSGSPCCDA